MSPNNSDNSTSKHLYFLSTTKLTEVSFVYFVNDILDPKKKTFWTISNEERLTTTCRIKMANKNNTV